MFELWSERITLILAIIVSGSVGFFCCALLATGKRTDERIERMLEADEMVERMIEGDR